MAEPSKMEKTPVEKLNKKHEQWKELPDLGPGHQPRNKANPISGTVMVKGKQHTIWRRRTVKLTEGILKFFKKQSRWKKRKIEEGAIDLGQSVVTYKSKKRRIFVEATGSTCSSYQMRPAGRMEFHKWLDGLTKHRFDRQNELRQAVKRRRESGSKLEMDTRASEMAKTVKQAECHIADLNRLAEEMKKETPTVASENKQSGTMDSFIQTAESLIQTLQAQLDVLNLIEEDKAEKKRNSRVRNAKVTEETIAVKKKPVARLRPSMSTPEIPAEKHQRLEHLEDEQQILRSRSRTQLNRKKTERKHISPPDSSRSTMGGTSKMAKASDTEASMEDDDTADELPLAEERRTVLPATVPKTESFSIWSLAKNKFQAPISVYEPLSLLQFLCEDLLYSELLDIAAVDDDEVERICWVSAFAVSSYAGTLHRGGRKPFNPLLGETFDLDRWTEKGWKMHAEQVSHHPPVSAVHADGRAGWTFWQAVGGDFKFTGNTFEIHSDSTLGLELHTHKESYTWNKVNSCIHRIQTPEKRCVSHFGEMIVQSSKLQCRITFQKGEENHEISAKVLRNGKLIRSLSGNWTKGLWTEKKKYFHAQRLPSDFKLYYGFSYFARELNELTEKVLRQICPTDSRLRPDQRLLEEGNMKGADSKKKELEQQQRERAAERQRKNESIQPLWFRPSSSGGKNLWSSNQKYWGAKSQNFETMEFPKLWEKDYIP